MSLRGSAASEEITREGGGQLVGKEQEEERKEEEGGRTLPGDPQTVCVNPNVRYPTTDQSATPRKLSAHMSHLPLENWVKGAGDVQAMRRTMINSRPIFSLQAR